MSDRIRFNEKGVKRITCAFMDVVKHAYTDTQKPEYIKQTIEDLFTLFKNAEGPKEKKESFVENTAMTIAIIAVIIRLYTFEYHGAPLVQTEPTIFFTLGVILIAILFGARELLKKILDVMSLAFWCKFYCKCVAKIWSSLRTYDRAIKVADALVLQIKITNDDISYIGAIIDTCKIAADTSEELVQHAKDVQYCFKALSVLIDRYSCTVSFAPTKDYMEDVPKENKGAI